MKLPECHCPNCGKLFNAAFTVEEDARPPRPGDFTVCLRCAHLLVFADDMTVREPTAAETVEIAGDRAFLDTQTLIAAYNKMFPDRA